jgi:hypothetical protein
MMLYFIYQKKQHLTTKPYLHCGSLIALLMAKGCWIERKWNTLLAVENPDSGCEH